VKKCRPQVCPHTAFLAQLKKWYYVLHKDSTEGITESVHNIDLLDIDENELEGETGPDLEYADS